MFCKIEKRICRPEKMFVQLSSLKCQHSKLKHQANDKTKSLVLLFTFQSTLYLIIQSDGIWHESRYKDVKLVKRMR